MRDKRFIIIKINSHSIAYSVIDGRSINFYGQNGNVFKSIDLSRMLEEIIDIPVYFKYLFERGMDALGCVMETDSMDLQDYYDIPSQFIPFNNQPIVRTPNAELLKSFDLDDNGMTLDIQIVPQIHAIYYNFTIATYNRLIMDIIVNPVDMLFIDRENNYMHTMEWKHDIKPFDAMEILYFLHPEYRGVNPSEINTNKHVIYR